MLSMGSVVVVVSQSLYHFTTFDFTIEEIIQRKGESTKAGRTKNDGVVVQICGVVFFVFFRISSNVYGLISMEMRLEV